MTYQIEIVELREQPAAVVHGHADSGHIGQFLEKAFSDVAAVVAAEHLTYTGAPFGRYTPTGDGGFDVEAGFPVSGPAVAAGAVEIITLPGGLVARTLHRGSYEGIGAAYEATGAWVQQHGFIVAGAPWETYLDGPEVPTPRTEVYFPVHAV